jgi:hypothetical protein
MMTCVRHTIGLLREGDEYIGQLEVGGREHQATITISASTTTAHQINMRLTSSPLLFALLTLQGASAALNEPCYGSNGVAGTSPSSPFLSDSH